MSVLTAKNFPLESKRYLDQIDEGKLTGSSYCQQTQDTKGGVTYGDTLVTLSGSTMGDRAPSSLEISAVDCRVQSDCCSRWLQSALGTPIDSIACDDPAAGDPSRSRDRVRRFLMTSGHVQVSRFVLLRHLRQAGLVLSHRFRFRRPDRQSVLSNRELAAFH